MIDLLILLVGFGLMIGGFVYQVVAGRRSYDRALTGYGVVLVGYGVIFVRAMFR